MTIGGKAHLAGVFRDVTDRKELETEIAEPTDRERRAIGQDLHDGLGQELTGLGYLAASLHRALESQASPEADIANRLATGIQHALDRALAIARGLVPVEIDAGGLMAALEELAAGTQRLLGIPCWFQCNRHIPVEDNHTATQLFRIAQEAVDNAVKHGKPRHVIVELWGDDGSVILRVHDDGIGIPEKAKQGPGMGLRIMEHRARMIGATLDIRPADGGGTLVTCTLP